MARDLSKFTLFHDGEYGQWVLKRDGAARALKRFAKKAEALDHASKRFGDDFPASVKIQTIDGKLEEERTYPRSMDPRQSKG